MSKADKYHKVISKEDIAILDLGMYTGDIEYVKTEKALEKACQEISNCLIIGIDYESRNCNKR